MNIEKRHLAILPKCYAANSIVVDGERRILLASEGDAPCLAWRGPDYVESHTVWDGPGGTMAIVPIPGTPCKSSIACSTGKRPRSCTCALTARADIG